MGHRNRPWRFGRMDAPVPLGHSAEIREPLRINGIRWLCDSCILAREAAWVDPGGTGDSLAEPNRLRYRKF
jgi:hypothetical protein